MDTYFIFDLCEIMEDSAQYGTLLKFVHVCRQTHEVCKPVVQKYEHKIREQAPAQILGDDWKVRIWKDRCDRKHRAYDYPAITEDGSDPTRSVREWCVHGKIHRDGDKPAITFGDGTQQWYQHGLLHRDNIAGLSKPAVIYGTYHEFPGTQDWCVHGKLHRDNDEPAVIWSDGVLEWYINGERRRENGQPAFIDPRGHH